MSTASSAKRVGVSELAEHIELGDAFCLDLRSTSHGDMIYGATRYDPKNLTSADKLAVPMPKGSGFIVLYDEHGDGKHLEMIALKLLDEGYGDIALLDGGFAAWKDAGGKMQERSMEQPVPGVTEHQITR